MVESVYIFYLCYHISFDFFSILDESPGAHAPKTTLAATIMKRGSQDSGTEGHLSETEVPELK